MLFSELQDFNAKLSDFGLATDDPTGDKTYISTQVVGTYGYAAPEYIETGSYTRNSCRFTNSKAYLAQVSFKLL